jgi:hypothetical protein
MQKIIDTIIGINNFKKKCTLMLTGILRMCICCLLIYYIWQILDICIIQFFEYGGKNNECQFFTNSKIFLKAGSCPIKKQKPPREKMEKS